MPLLEDRIADLVCGQFAKLPAKSKPTHTADGTRGWVPLSGIVLANDEDQIECVALATGMKCLPLNKVSHANGCILHDWHAEILAIRGFNALLVQECLDLAKSTDYTSPYLCRQPSNSSGVQPFALRERLKIHMYCSEAPCGDASMELIMIGQEDATPWQLPTDNTKANQEGLLHGRGYFSELGKVRRKPSRIDSPPTLSKSCSDKLAMKQCTSLLCSPASLLISPENMYIDKLILPSSQYVPGACERAFSTRGRMEAASAKKWPGGYSFRPFHVDTTSNEFEYSRRGIEMAIQPYKGSNISALWTPRSQETLIGGVLQGRKQTDARGCSSASRVRIWKTVFNTATLLAMPVLRQAVSSSSYSAMKASNLLEDRNRVKMEVKESVLTGWIPNRNDDFQLEEDQKSYTYPS